MNHEKNTSNNVFKKLFSRKKKKNKGKFNTMGKIVKVSENIADFKRLDPAVGAGLDLRHDIEKK